jgi:hypothetical protein
VESVRLADDYLDGVERHLIGSRRQRWMACPTFWHSIRSPMPCGPTSNPAPPSGGKSWKLTRRADELPDAGAIDFASTRNGAAPGRYVPQPRGALRQARHEGHGAFAEVRIVSR